MSKLDLKAFELHDIIEVTWYDAFYVDHWELSCDYETEMDAITSVGYYLLTTDRYFIIAQSLQPDQVGHVFRIPRRSILAIKPLA